MAFSKALMSLCSATISSLFLLALVSLVITYLLIIYSVLFLIHFSLIFWEILRILMKNWLRFCSHTFAESGIQIAHIPNKGTGIEVQFSRIEVQFENLKNGLRFGDFDFGVRFQSRLSWNGPYSANIILTIQKFKILIPCELRGFLGDSCVKTQNP